MAPASASARNCPICGGGPRGKAFPYATRFDDRDFAYLRCASCATVFVDPVPQADTLRRMYAKADYHDRHYDGGDQAPYRDSVAFLSSHLAPGKRILDYGCGTGSFLCACADLGYIPVGVDFEPDVARAAGARAGCAHACIEDFEAAAGEPDFDAIHLGDVLEHLSDPLATLSFLVGRLVAGGLLYVEGPLEVNPSPVYWSARLFGRVKRILRPSFLASHPPTHLWRTDAAGQERFFSRLQGGFHLIAWKLEETGWPYDRGGLVKRFIADLARGLGGREILGLGFGNRFKAILVKPSAAPHPESVA